MATFAELVLESIESNNYHGGMVTGVDHDNKVIHVSSNKSYVMNTAGKYAKYGAVIGGVSGALGGALGGGVAGGLAGKAAGMLSGKSRGTGTGILGGVGGALGGAAVGGVTRGINTGLSGAATGAIVGLYKKRKDRKMVDQLLRSGYTIQYDD